MPQTDNLEVIYDNPQSNDYSWRMMGIVAEPEESAIRSACDLAIANRKPKTDHLWIEVFTDAHTRGSIATAIWHSSKPKDVKIYYRLENADLDPRKVQKMIKGE